MTTILIITNLNVDGFLMFKNEKGIVQLFLLLFLIAAIGIGLYLSQNTQIFKPRASEYGGSGGPYYGCKFSPEEVKGEEPCKLFTQFGDSGPEYNGADGFRYANIKCADGFEQKKGDGASCSTQAQWETRAIAVCQNHASCTNLNDSDPRTALTVTFVDSSNYGDLSFDPIIGSDEFKVLHTAVWRGSSSEKEAKSGKVSPRYKGFADKAGASVEVTYPSYVEYYSVDKGNHQEKLNKRVVTHPNYSRSIEVTKMLTSKNTGTVLPIQNTALSSAPVQIGGDVSLGSPAKFSYLAPDVYDLKYFIPAGFTVSAIEWTYKGVSNVITKNSDEAVNKNPAQNRYGYAKVAAPDDEGGVAIVKIDYSDEGSIDTKPVTPITDSKPVIICDIANSKAILKSIPDKNVENIDLRVDSTKGGGWNGSCTSPLAGDFCKDKLQLTSPYTFNIEPNQKYNLFYTVNYLGKTTNSKNYSFTCQSPKAECLSSNSVRISFAPVAGAVKYAVRLDNTNNPWKGVNNNAGDTTDDMGTTSKVYDITSGAGAPYTFWYHGVDASGKLSDPVYGSFVCPADSGPRLKKMPLTSEEENNGAYSAEVSE